MICEMFTSCSVFVSSSFIFSSSTSLSEEPALSLSEFVAWDLLSAASSCSQTLSEMLSAFSGSTTSGPGSERENQIYFRLASLSPVPRFVKEINTEWKKRITYKMQSSTQFSLCSANFTTTVAPKSFTL